MSFTKQLGTPRVWAEEEVTTSTVVSTIDKKNAAITLKAFTNIIPLQLYQV
jgi:hypothetical protein